MYQHNYCGHQYKHYCDYLQPKLCLLTCVKHNNNLANFYIFYFVQIAKQKVKELARKVEITWRGDFLLVITHAYVSRDQPHTEIHDKFSLHHVGRALDLTLGYKNKDGTIVTIYSRADMRRKLMELASLARSGEMKFEYARIKAHHIHVSTRRV